MSTDTLPNTIEDLDTGSSRRVTLTRSGVAALFAQSSYDTGEKISTANLSRPVRDYRPPPTARSWVNASSTSSSNTNNLPNSTKLHGTSATPNASAQRSSLFRFVVQRSSSFATGTLSQALSNTRRQTLKPIRSICNQHDKVSSIDTEVEPVASITNCLEAPSIAAVQICRSISMPNTAAKYRQHYEQQQRLLVQSTGKPL